LTADYLKIDGGFVRDMLQDPMDAAIVAAINNIGHVAGLKTIAEFVENAEIQSQLAELGVDYAQGYGIHRPELIAIDAVI
jgi:EAL domain-containing protein (putative c-di-GMP-specific phosphodiesterase class I)